MKKKVDEKLFDDLIEEFAAPILKWQRKKPAKRNAFLLFRDGDAEEYAIRLMGNARAKHPMPTSLEGLSEAMVDCRELLGWVKANVRFAERELKRKYELQNTTKNGNSNS